MKKFAVLIMFTLFASFTVTSCLPDDSNATATVNYVGRVDSINFTDSVDSVWIKDIARALQKMEVLYYAFEVSDTATSLYSFAVAKCNNKAGEILNNKLNAVTLKDVKKNIFNLNADSIIGLGYSCADSIPLDRFTLHSSMWSYLTGEMVYYFKHDIK